jgi:hypothetical protein
MHIAIRWSLGNYWWVSGWGLLDHNYELFPETVMDDPRPGAAPGTPPRDALDKECTAQATSVHSINWTDFDIVMLWFAQPTDMYGGGTQSVRLPDGSTKNVRVTVVDVASWYNGCCQELGHSYGFSHELDSKGNEYGSPYSVMSARGSFEFLHAKDARLPLGDVIKDPTDPYIGHEAQLVTSPMLPAAQLYSFAGFKQYVNEATLSLTGFPPAIILNALDFAREHRETMAVTVLTSFINLAGKRFFIELRRSGYGYDQPVTTALVIHSKTAADRIEYDGNIPLTNNPSPAWIDIPFFMGNFTLRLLEIGNNYEYAKIQLIPGFWLELDNNSASVDIVADGNNLYQLHQTGRIWKYTGTPHTGWMELDNNGDTKKIIASGGNLYQLHRTGKIWKYTGTPHTGWQELDNNGDTAYIVADGNNLYQLHQTGKIWKYTGTPHTGWLELDNNGDTKKIIASGGNLYQLHRTGKIWKYTGTPHTGWQELDNNGDTADIVADGNNLYQLHRTGKIWKYTGTPHTGWLELDNNGDTKKIAAAGGSLYQIHNTGMIWKYMGIPLTGWMPIDKNSDSISIVAAPGSIYQMHRSGRIWFHVS